MPAPILPAPILLVIVAAYTLAIAWRGRTFRVRLALPGRGTRGHRMTAWALGLAVSFALPAVLGLALLGQDPLRAGQPAAMRVIPHDWPLLPTTPLVLGMVLGTIVNAAITHWRWRRGKTAFEIAHLPDVAPQARSELWPATALSLSAGVSEELYFRLFLPLLIAMVSGDAVMATILATLLFGAVHRYQGVRGMIATTIVGGGLAVIYGLTGTLWMAIALHVVIDLNALVVRPLARGAWRRSGPEGRVHPGERLPGSD
jgi:membrane protease YdiL (CAAX protease family)